MHAAIAQNLVENAVVPNRFIVVYRNGVVPLQANAQARALGGRMVARQSLLGIGVVQASGASADAVLKALQRDSAVEYAVHDRIVTARSLLQIRPVAPTVPGGAPPLRPRPMPIAPGYGVVVDGSQSSGDSYYTSTPQGWAVKQVGGYGHGVAGGPAYGPWDLSMGAGVRIAILDSGVDEQHPDIAPNLVLNMSEVDQTAMPSPCDDGSPQDQQGHGTWTASLAAGAMGSGTGMVVGVAPQAEILNIKVLERMPTGGTGSQTAQCEGGEASGLLSWVIQGIEDAVSQHADVISMSLGVLVDLYTGDGAGLKATFDQITHAAAMNDVVLVAAAGNDGFDLSNTRYIELPAQARDVLPVVASTNPNCAQNLTTGATCQDGSISLAYYSDYGAPLAGVAAPGGSYPEGADTAVSGFVRGACSNGKPNTVDGLPADSAHSFGCFALGHTQYVQAMGTSAAAPLAAGVAALLRGAHPEWDAYTILNAMRQSATRGPGNVNSSPFNYGLVNAATALSLHWKAY
ncbi:MAG: S8 family peptidase [Acidobacteriaceae bacterium]